MAAAADREAEEQEADTHNRVLATAAAEEEVERLTAELAAAKVGCQHHFPH